MAKNIAHPLPLLTPAIFFEVITNIIGTFQIFTARVLSGTGAATGGPGQSMLFYVLYLYNRAFVPSGSQLGFQMGYASALFSWILFIIILLITLIQLALANRWVYYESEGKTYDKAPPSGQLNSCVRQPPPKKATPADHSPLENCWLG
ncbi:MAG: hypothetical protein R2867_34020 [Caldilineaceae bacterium]